MREKRYTFSQVFDIYGVRVLVPDKTACYAALGVLHELYKPIPGKFKDYIAIPKANGYQSLHTTLFGPFGTPLEAQIRTHDMHRVAEAGVAAHWLYKSGGELDLAEAQRETHRWLQSLLEIQSESRDSKEFLENIKGDLFPDEIYVFTPKGKIMALPRGATAVDFAYAVHTDIGHHCVAARINYELLPLRTELKNGDHVEILTSPTARPNPSWLSFVATGKARSRIRHFLKGLQQKESAALGERLLDQALATLKVEPESITWDRWEALQKEYGAKSQLDILADIGLGKRLSFVVAQALTRPAGKADDAGATPAPIAQAGRADAARRRRRGDPVREVLPADSRRRDRRPVPQGPGPARAHARLRHAARSSASTPSSWSTSNGRPTCRACSTPASGCSSPIAAACSPISRTAIADADANIDNVSMERPDGGDVLAMFFACRCATAPSRARDARAEARARREARAAHADLVN